MWRQGTGSELSSLFVGYLQPRGLESSSYVHIEVRGDSRDHSYDKAGLTCANFLVGITGLGGIFVPVLDLLLPLADSLGLERRCQTVVGRFLLGVHLIGLSQEA